MPDTPEQTYRRVYRAIGRTYHPKMGLADGGIEFAGPPVHGAGYGQVLGMNLTNRAA